MSRSSFWNLPWTRYCSDWSFSCTPLDAKLDVVQLGRVAAPAAVNLLDRDELALLRLAARAWALARARRDVAALYAELLAHLVAAVLVRALTLPRASSVLPQLTHAVGVVALPLADDIAVLLSACEAASSCWVSRRLRSSSSRRCTLAFVAPGSRRWHGSAQTHEPC